MKVNEPLGIHFHMEQISPEVAREQRMAELEQISKYRARRLREYQEWSDPVKRAERQAKVKGEEIQAKMIFNEQIAKDPNFYEKIAVRPSSHPKSPFMIRPLAPAFPNVRKITRWGRIKRWFFALSRFT